MSTRADALARLDAARHKVVIALHAAGEATEAGAYQCLPEPGKKGWFGAYMFRIIFHASLFQAAKTEIDRVKSRATRAGTISVGMSQELAAMERRIVAAEDALSEFLGVLGEVVEEGFSPHGFASDKPTRTTSPKGKVVPARRRKATPS